MLELLTLKDGAQNHRLKVLWIEDKLSESLSTPATLSRYFTIWRAWEPDDISVTLRQDLREIYSKRGDAKTYTLPCLPVDGFLADFNLKGAGKSAKSRVINEVDIKPFPDPPQTKDLKHKSKVESARPNENDLTALPSAAEAAGLTAAVLTALNFDYHPAVVVPYTAYPEHISRQRALIRLLVPISLVISQKSELDLGKESLEKKLEQFAEDYRNNLPVWAVQHIVSIPSGEVKRLRSLANSRIHVSQENEQVQWQDSDCIVIDTLYGRRAISCGSLWYKSDETGPSLADVEGWLDKMPTPTAVYSAAVRLADEYWRYSETETSRYRYTLSRLIRSLKTETAGSDVSFIKSNIKLFCDLFGVEFKGALDNPSAVKMPARKHIPPLLSSGETREVRRLAVFFLLAMEYAARWATTQDEADELWKLIRILDFKVEMGDSLVRTFDEINVDRINGLDFKRLSQVMIDLGYDGLASEQGELLLHRVHVQESDMAQRLDPVPEQLLTTEEKFSGERIYQQLKRIGIDLDAVIANTESGADIKPDERKAVQHFALDINYPPRAWPEWLRKDYV